MRPDAIEFYGNRRFVLEGAAPLQVIVSGRDRYVITPGLGFDRGQRVTRKQLRRRFWVLKQITRE
jgi:hypothetical protein